MSCYCDYDSMPSFHREAFRTARKPHNCCECNASINPGEQYQHITGKWDGVIMAFKTCVKCADLRDALSEVGCPSLGEMFAFYKEYLEETGKVIYDEDSDLFVYPENHIIDSKGYFKSWQIRRAA